MKFFTFEMHNSDTYHLNLSKTNAIGFDLEDGDLLTQSNGELNRLDFRAINNCKNVCENLTKILASDSNFIKLDLITDDLHLFINLSLCSQITRNVDSEHSDNDIVFYFYNNNEESTMKFIVFPDDYVFTDEEVEYGYPDAIFESEYKKIAANLK